MKIIYINRWLQHLQYNISCPEIHEMDFFFHSIKYAIKEVGTWYPGFHLNHGQVHHELYKAEVIAAYPRPKTPHPDVATDLYSNCSQFL